MKNKKNYCDYCLREFRNLYRHKGETYCYFCKEKIFKRIGNIDLGKLKVNTMEEQRKNGNNQS
jgi:hypothetical protein|tara:strand:- start:5 stop:193 length:189 start_codon:yes stop_codon:yes gene_type:complete